MFATGHAGLNRWRHPGELMRAAPLGGLSRVSAVAEVGPNGRDGGRGGVRAAASKMGDTGKAVRECVELPVIDRDAGRAQRQGVFVTLVAQWIESCGEY